MAAGRAQDATGQEAYDGFDELGGAAAAATACEAQDFVDCGAGADGAGAGGAGAGEEGVADAGEGVRNMHAQSCIIARRAAKPPAGDVLDGPPWSRPRPIEKTLA